MSETKEVNSYDEGQRWQNELRLAKREDEKFIKRGKKIVKRYRDERQGWSDTAKRFNILWANVQTMRPAIYGRVPKAQVERRHKDQDPVGRTASAILERALQYEIDHYGDYHAAIKQAVVDRLLPGRGVAWVRFETDEYERPESEEVTDDVQAPEIEYERTPVDYVYWEDFRCSPARNWEEVTWVARRVYMSREEGEKRFGDKFATVPLTHEPIGLDEMEKQGATKGEMDAMRKAQVWEIWSKPEECVYWVADGFTGLLDHKEDPYGLDNFWPCPRPLFATQTTDTLVPVPDFSMYQDQADELDKLTQRIAMLTEAVKVVGVYDASQTGVQRMLNEGVNNTLIPVDTWAAFAEKGGLKGVVDFMPLETVLAALQQCYVAREQAKQVIYEITGLSDIIRGSSVASETATAQQIKSQYGSLRLKDAQLDVARFASEVLQIKAQLMCDLYRPETLVEMSGIMGTQDAQFAEAAVQLLKAEPSRNFRIEVAADSLVELDEQAEKQARGEFLQSIGGFMQQALPVVQQAPEMAPLIGEMILFGVRAFKGARPIEAVFDEVMAKLSNPQPKPPQPDPEQIKLQGQMQIEGQRMQLEQAKLQGSTQLEQVKMQQSQALEQFKAQQAMALEQMRQDAETQRAEFKARLEAETKLQIAQLTAQSSIASEAGKQTETVKTDMTTMIQDVVNQISEALEAQRVASETAVQELRGIMDKPKRVVRGNDGKVVGVEINGVVRNVERGPDGRVIGV